MWSCISCELWSTYKMNMNAEALIGFNAFNTRKQIGQDVGDFIKYRQTVAQGAEMDDELFDAVLPKPK
jgi:6-oxo-cyclohex-1-ene-carbonyl-CoA hydrolase